MKKRINKRFDKCCILNGAQYFSSGMSQTYLVFIPAEKYLKYFSDTSRIDWWKSNRMSEKKY